ncbi:Palmitoyl-protein thioesterase 1 [Golovinomyces cichoracearum]|uniref:Palmitoyl-protein thioesterase 1 n=1 Tax=Golovinomyces cichoracearum TaxID=62708 RepID=A0A420J7K2_9PEZI|nr:Palmitoyl-protein thioesterase 1 [Golovinomyces cichoracearum]
MVRLFNQPSLFAAIFGTHLAMASSLLRQSPLSPKDAPIPLVIWHGMGDSHNSKGMASIASVAEAANPGTFTYMIRVEDDGISDRSLTYFGNISSQIETVCAEMAAHPILSTAPAVDALGFSQGGQFLRGYVERCNNPPVRSLVTFGAQHNGISKLNACDQDDFLCNFVQGLLRDNIWSEAIQSYVVPAQYFRDPTSLDEYNKYLENSNFLADINNEREHKNEDYKKNLIRLERFVMYMFQDDKTVVPKESGWFAEVNGSTVTPLQERSLYKEDWLGLKILDEKHALKFHTVPGSHMQLDDNVLEEIFKKYFGPFGRKFDDEDEIRIDTALIEL